MAIDKITLVATDNLFENTEISGTEAAKMPVGTTAQRANAQSGDIRFNSSTSLMEYYDGVQWKSIDSPPAISSISPSNIGDSDSSVDITINGSNFIAGGQTVTAIGSDGSTITAGTVTRVSSAELTANFDGTSFDNAQEPYDIKVENNSSGLSISSDDVLNVNATPAWTVSAGSLGTIYDTGRTGVSITTGATDDEGATLTYSVSVGSLPAGLSIDSSTGTISGNATAVGSDTTSTFTLSVTDGTNTVTRQYSITINASTVTSYTSIGSGTFAVPSGVSSVDVLVVAGGGGGGGMSGGGAGGLIYRPAFPVSPGGSVSYTVGSGGAEIATPGGPTPNGGTGQDSLFGDLRAKGGGSGGGWEVAQGQNQGGSGGGGTYTGTSNQPNFGQATQPQQPGDSGTYGFGNPGGVGVFPMPGGSYLGGGGGGAGAAGLPEAQGGHGGAGRAYDIFNGTQYYYAGGGGAGAQGPRTAGQGGLGGASGGAGNPSDGTPGQGTSMHNGNQAQASPGSSEPAGAPYGLAGDAATNSGSGGGAMAVSVGRSGAGGSGIVIVKY